MSCVDLNRKRENRAGQEATKGRLTFNISKDSA